MQEQLLHPVDFEIQERNTVTGIALFWKHITTIAVGLTQTKEVLPKPSWKNSDQLTSHVNTKQTLIDLRILRKCFKHSLQTKYKCIKQWSIGINNNMIFYIPDRLGIMNIAK